MTKIAFAPGCALMLYKPQLAFRIHASLKQRIPELEMLSLCCKSEPYPGEASEIINLCPGCDRRYSNDYPSTHTRTLWEVLDQAENFPFPDHGGRRMTILDACPTRQKPEVHAAIRSLLKKMNITVTEPEKTGGHGTCCGDTFYGLLPVEKVLEQMQKRSDEMPEEEVVVYCVSCSKSIANGGKRPRYLPDLLLGEPTEVSVTDPDEWHAQLSAYIQDHLA
ncbi:MAG: (Fe-S)-binding protein [Marinilabiliales bacterium]|nr:(Fe-S)-binding protein [Marinilabiliales bacterium]